MDILERLERKDAMRSEYRRREEILHRHNLRSSRCLITSVYEVSCGMLPAVSEDTCGNIVFYHEGCCSEAHRKLFDVFKVNGDEERKKKVLEDTVKKVVEQFRSKISDLIEKHGRDKVFEYLDLNV